MNTRTWAQRLAAVAVLNDPVRCALYEYVAASPKPVGRDQASEALSLNRGTVAFHLDKLVAEGLLCVEYRRLGKRTGPGAGRPAKLYSRPDAEIIASVPDRHYDLLGELLAASIEQSMLSGQPINAILPAIAYAAGQNIGTAAESLETALRDNGFQPRSDGCEGWVLGNCPFHRLARQFTQLVCGLNLELVRGIAKGVGDRAHVMELDPGPDRCCVHVAQVGADRV